jgi:hypothetical protein
MISVGSSLKSMLLCEEYVRVFGGVESRARCRGLWICT